MPRPRTDRADATGPRRMRSPATRDQVDAYRFGLRRLEAALVRGDPVLLHERGRSQRRAVTAGALLGLLALAATAAVALVSPRPQWTRQAVVVGAESGAMYVVAHGPDRLVPVANLVAARLVLGALQGGGVAAGDAAVPVTVPDEALARAPRTAAAAVAGAEAVRPDAAGIPPHWAVCDEVTVGGSGRARIAGTTVVAGGASAAAAPEGAGVLLAVPDGATWLVVDGRRHRVDTADPVVLATLGLAGAVPRPASAALASAVPEGVRLERPMIPGLGDPGPPGLRERVGDVLVVRPAGGEPRHHLVLSEGIQEVPAALAQVLHAERSAVVGSTAAAGAPRPASAGPREVDAGQVADVTVVERLAVRGWPDAAPRLIDVADAPVLCWAWSGAPGAAPEGTVTAGRSAALPEAARTVALAQADGAGPRLDAVVFGPGGGGPVRSVGIGGPAGTGVVHLISDTGVAYGVASGDTARVLGIGDAPPAPEPAVRLLPCGPAIDAASADELVDVPEAPGCG